MESYYYYMLLCCGKQPNRWIFINNSWQFQGQNGILELSIRGHEDTFEVRIPEINSLERLECDYLFLRFLHQLFSSSASS